MNLCSDTFIHILLSFTFVLGSNKQPGSHRLSSVVFIVIKFTLG